MKQKVFQMEDIRAQKPPSAHAQKPKAPPLATTILPLVDAQSVLSNQAPSLQSALKSSIANKDPRKNINRLNQGAVVAGAKSIAIDNSAKPGGKYFKKSAADDGSKQSEQGLGN